MAYRKTELGGLPVRFKCSELGFSEKEKGAVFNCPSYLNYTTNPMDYNPMTSKTRANVAFTAWNVAFAARPYPYIESPPRQQTEAKSISTVTLILLGSKLGSCCF